MKNPSWLYQESVMALQRVRHGFARSPSRWDNASKSRSQSPQVMHSSQRHDGLLTEPPTLTDFSQGHDRVLAEPRRTPCRAMRDSW